MAKSKNGIHAERLKAIRPFVSFNYNLNRKLSKYQKRKIKKYYDEIQTLTARPIQIYRGRDPKKLKAVQKYSRHTQNLRELKVAFVPTGGNKVTIKVSKSGKVTTETKHVKNEFLEFDPFQLLENPIEHAREVIEPSKAKSFTIAAGEYEIPTGYNKDSVIDRIGSLAERYSDESKNNHFSNWMFGVTAHSYKRQASFNKYVNDRKKAVETGKKKRKAKKRKSRS